MNLARAEALWRRAVDALAARGQLPPDASPMTPAELAARVRAAGDDRPQRFVMGYYYPARYGHREGAMSESAAEELVRDIESGGPRPDQTSGVDVRAVGSARRCTICGTRPVE